MWQKKLAHDGSTGQDITAPQAMRDRLKVEAVIGNDSHAQN